MQIGWLGWHWDRHSWKGKGSTAVHRFARYPQPMGGPITSPGLHIVSCHVMEREWSVTFYDLASKMHIGPWLLCDSAEEVMKILTWGHIYGSDLDEHHRNIARWGVGGGTLRLTSRERHQLIARGHGWPWNGYELRKMKEAGRYPPRRLTFAQEAAYRRNREGRAERG